MPEKALAISVLQLAVNDYLAGKRQMAKSKYDNLSYYNSAKSFLFPKTRENNVSLWCELAEIKLSSIQRRLANVG